jgi:hypothetical protein
MSHELPAINYIYFATTTFTPFFMTFSLNASVVK